MSDWSNFTTKEIDLIISKSKKEFDLGMKVTLFLSPLACVIAPYLPSRKGRDRLIDTMDYEKVVLIWAIIWVGILIITWISNNQKVEKEFWENRKFLRRKFLTAKIKKKEKSFFKKFENKLITDLKWEFRELEVSNEQSSEFEIGDDIQIEIEEQTRTVLKINKLS